MTKHAKQSHRLNELINMPNVQSMVESHYTAAAMPIGIIDAFDGSILAGAGWQDVCTRFHRINPTSLARCRESDLAITERLKPGEACAYKCRNGLWDIGIPILVKGQHLATLFLGQFFYEGENADLAFFERQASELGFDKAAYLEALARVPVFSKEKVENILAYNKAFAVFLGQMAEASLDQTEQMELSRRTREVLKESEVRFRALFENAPLPYQSLDEHGFLLDVNKKWLESLGYSSKDEVVGKWFGDFLAPGFKEHFDRNFPIFKQACIIDGVEFDMVHKDGGFITVSFNGRVQLNKLGEFERTHCIFTDITARKGEDEALRREETRLRKLVEIFQHQQADTHEFLDLALEQCIELTDSRFGYLYLYDEDAQTFQLNSWSREVMKDCSIVKPQTCYELSKTGIWGEAVRQRCPIIVNDFEAEHPLKKGYPEGHATLSRFLTVPVISNHRIVAVVGVANKGAEYSQTDSLQLILFMEATWRVVEQRRAENDLRANEEKYRLLFAGAKDPILVADTETGILVECNAAAVEFIGRTRDAIIGSHQSTLHPPIPPTDKYSPEFKRHLENPSLIQEAELLASGGQIRLMSVNSAIFEVRGRKLIIGTFRDITHERVAQKTIIQAKEEAEAASRSKSEFLATMSHEIRTPLNGVLGMLQLAMTTDLSPEQQEYLQTALQSGRSLLRVLTDILDISRIEAGAMPLISNDFPVDDVFTPITHAFGEEAHAKGISFKCEIDPHLPNYLHGDAGRIRQICYNIVGNALKYTTRGEVRMKIYPLPSRIEVDEMRLHLEVSDTGIGIPEDMLPRLFEPFTQVDGSITRRYGGTGLGLAIVKRLVNLMDGNIAIYSEPGIGTEVHVDLPLKLAKAAPSPLKSELPAESRMEVPRLSVLLAEDDKVNSLAVSTMLTKSGHEVHSVSDGAIALQYLATQHVDCVLMDIQMPEMDGMEATRRIRAGEAGEAARAIPIVALTAHAMKGDREEFLAAGMDGYISKPVDMDELERVLAEVVARKQD